MSYSSTVKDKHQELMLTALSARLRSNSGLLHIAGELSNGCTEAAEKGEFSFEMETHLKLSEYQLLRAYFEAFLNLYVEVAYRNVLDVVNTHPDPEATATIRIRWVMKGE